MKNKDSITIIESLRTKRLNCETIDEKDFLSIYFFDKTVDTVDIENVSNDSLNAQIAIFEQPDLLVINQDKILAIEHFQVDYSFHNRKGSSFKSKYNPDYVLKKQLEVHERLKERPYIIDTEQIETELCYKNLFDNIVRIFEKHYSKILEYEKNIKRLKNIHYSEIEYVFFIEYNVVLPSFTIMKNNKMRVIYPHNDLKLINYLKDKEKISGIIFDVPAFNEIPGYMKFILTDKINLNKYEPNEVSIFDLTNIKVEDFTNPIMSSGWINTQDI